MRCSLIILFVTFCKLVCFGQSDTTMVSNPLDTTTYVYGNVMYEKGSYSVAIAVYENLLIKNGPSSQVYFNLGNAYYKDDQIGNAILSYERARFLGKNDNDVQYNLALANQRIRDNIEPIPTSLFQLWWHAIINKFSTTGWAIITIILLWFALGGFVVYLHKKFVQFQRQGFYVFVVAAVLFVFAFAAAAGKNAYDKKYQFAIVMAQSAVVKSEPSENSTNLFLIHEGLKLQLLFSDAEWSEIELPDGNVGWIKNTAIKSVNPFIIEQN
jgi:hypothetical protein